MTQTFAKENFLGENFLQLIPPLTVSDTNDLIKRQLTRQSVHRRICKLVNQSLLTIKIPYKLTRSGYFLISINFLIKIKGKNQCLSVFYKKPSHRLVFYLITLNIKLKVFSQKLKKFSQRLFGLQRKHLWRQTYAILLMILKIKIKTISSVYLSSPIKDTLYITVKRLENN